MSIQTIRAFIDTHAAGATGLAALGAALDAKASGTTLDAKLAERVQSLLDTLDVGDALAGMTADEAKPFLTEIRTMNALEAQLLYPRPGAASWNYTSAEVLQGAGAMSAGFVAPLARMVVPSLEGLAERLAAPHARFLDVGVGVAGLAVAVARTWPNVHVVGIDPWQPSLALARENVARAGLADRIELREQRAEHLEEEGVFDLGWLPALFVPMASVRPACDRVHRALRPGGWILFSAVDPVPDPRTEAMWRLRLAMFGDSAMSAADAEALLRDVGLVDVKTLPSPAGSNMRLVAGRRAIA